MAGIYIHIPFCKQACYYCNFHFSTSTALRKKMVEAIRHEMRIRRGFLGNETVRTLYFGGGTPSLLDISDIGNIIDDVFRSFHISPDPEITLEANPDDLSQTRTGELKALGINRLSIGIQSFDNATLEFLHRVHNAETALHSLEYARQSGFSNINADIIFGIRPGHFPVLKNDVKKIISMGVEHISAYCLTIEPETVFGNWGEKGKIELVGEEETAEQYEYIIDELTSAGYEHYEISNFALKNRRSVHNTGYWMDEKYLGLGPAAHSYDHVNRYYNVSNNNVYIRRLSEDIIPETIDYLSVHDRVNEYIMTSLRTGQGCDLNYLNRKFGITLENEAISYIENLKKLGYIVKTDNLIQLTKKGKLIADRIASDLFIG